jgi:hypothetical protein
MPVSPALQLLLTLVFGVSVLAYLGLVIVQAMSVRAAPSAAAEVSMVSPERTPPEEAG